MSEIWQDYKILEKEALEIHNFEVREEKNVVLYTESKLQNSTNIGWEMQVLNDKKNVVSCTMYDGKARQVTVTIIIPRDK
jgi:hypothetical protein